MHVGSCRGLHILFKHLLTRVRQVGDRKSFSTTERVIRHCNIGVSRRLRSRVLRHCGTLRLSPCGKFVGPMCAPICSGRNRVTSVRISCKRTCSARVLHCNHRCTALPCVGRW